MQNSIRQRLQVTERIRKHFISRKKTAAKVTVSTVKEIAGETDEITVGMDVSEFQGMPLIGKRWQSPALIL